MPISHAFMHFGQIISSKVSLANSHVYLRNYNTLLQVVGNVNKHDIDKYVIFVHGWAYKVIKGTKVVVIS